MKEEEIKKLEKDGKVEDVTPPIQPPAPAIPAPVDLSAFITVLNAIKVVKRHVTTAPTYVPRNFWEQFAFYDDGVIRRVYIYVNGSWRYAVLT